MAARRLFTNSGKRASSSESSDHEGHEYERWRPISAAQWLGCALIILIIALAPFLNGSTERWAQGIVLMLIGLGVVIFPPKKLPHRYAGWVTLSAIVLAASAFLPIAEFWRPLFHRNLETQLALDLPPTLSPQPVVSLECFALLVSGLLWWWWVPAVCDERALRARIVRGTAGMILILAVVALGDTLKLWQVPFWPRQAPLGPFPNKNQMGGLLATWGAIVLACGIAAAQARRWTTILWFAGLGLLLWAVLWTASRAAIVLLVVGLGWWTLREASTRHQWRAAAIAAGVCLCITAMFFAFGGHTYVRTLQFFSALNTDSAADLRVPIFRDTFTLLRDAPITGLGLGNFESVFAFYRQASATPSRALHPESDWMWLTAEMGWLAPLCAGLLIVPALRGRLQNRHSPTSSLLLAARIGGILFLVHGFVDVSGHRLGSALPGLALLALGSSSRVTDPSRALPWVARAIGAAIFVTGSLWVSGHNGWISLPGETAILKAKELASASNTNEKFEITRSATTKALSWAPLDWELFFSRGIAEVYLGDVPAAQQDFRRARLLESSGSQIAFEEGVLWAFFAPPLAREAWDAALSRVPPDQKQPMFARMLQASIEIPAMRPVLREIAGNERTLLLLYLQAAPAQEFAREAGRLALTARDLASLTTTERRQFLATWKQKGDQKALAELLESRPELLPEGWRFLAEIYAERGQHEHAVTLGLKYLPTPNLPAVPQVSLESAQREFLRDPANVVAGYQTYLAQLSLGRNRDALATLNKLAALSQKPKYVEYLRAKLLADLAEWQPAWNAVRACN